MVDKPHSHMARTDAPFDFLQRRRVGAVALALIGLLATLRLRGSCETPLSIGLEIALQSGLVGLWWILTKRYRQTNLPADNQFRKRYLIACAAALAITPWALQLVMRALHQGTGLELVAMSSFGWVTLLASLGAQRRRGLGTSVICSGFLTLLVTCSSEHSVALLLALAWGGLCLWWLASSHWERAQQCQVNTVVAHRGQRPLVVLAGCAVFALSAWSVAGRFPAAERLRWEVAPTSGGTSVHDEFARSGTGDGDAVVAAREHAASFGAVDSDLMLDSKEASLFDLYSDTFGEPVRRQDVERSVALAQQQEMSQPGSMAESDGASASLTTQRRPSKAVKALNNRASDALLFWMGRPDTHLALERFSHFDGVTWSTSAPQMRGLSAGETGPSRALQPIPSGNHTWFAVSGTESIGSTASPFQGLHAEAIKYARLKSPRIPTLAGMHSWHIRQVDDASFFQVDEEDNLVMPGRKSVPEYTIVRYINREIHLEPLEQVFGPLPSSALRDSSAVNSGSTHGEKLAAETVRRWFETEASKESNLPAGSSRWKIVCGVIERLRQQYRLDRTVDTSSLPDPLAAFIEQRSGNDLMFATAAAVMLRELGFETRLVTGFVARKENRQGWTREMAVFADDTHAWLEVRANAAIGFHWSPRQVIRNRSFA